MTAPGSGVTVTVGGLPRSPAVAAAGPGGTRNTGVGRRVGIVSAKFKLSLQVIAWVET